MERLSIDETIARGSGKFWWRDGKVVDGIVPAKSNIFKCYVVGNQVFKLYKRYSGSHKEGAAAWWVRKASPKLAKIVLYFEQG